MTAVVVLGIVCGALFVLLVVASILLCCSLNMSVAEAKRIRADIIAGALKAAQKLPSEKPDAAKECGVKEPPKFDEQPRRKGKYKICISFWFNGGRPAWFHDLAEFYRTEGVRKCDFSPSCRMEEEKRLEFIARRIGVHYRAKGAFVRGVSITRRGKQYHFDHFPYPAGVQK